MNEPAKTIDLHAYADQKSPGIFGRTVHLPTPEQQLQQLRETPGVSPDQVAAGESWTDAEDKRRKNFGLDWVKERRSVNDAVGSEVAGAMFEDRNDSHALCQRAKAGTVTAAELLREAKELRDRMTYYERQVDRIEESERLIGEVEDDPAAYFYRFYSRYPILAERLPTLADHLYDREEKKSPGPRLLP